MGSLRTPVGPLPSSIYWRRRLVMLLLIALLALLLIWALRPGDGGGTDATGSDDEGGPAASITPGPPAPSESFIDERPGGREEPEPGDDGTSGDGDTGETGDTGEDGGAGEATDGGSGGTAGSGSGGQGEDTGGEVPVTGLPVCGEQDVTLSLLSEQNEYALGEEPVLLLTAENVSGTSCQMDFGYGGLTVTIADSEDDQVWSSAECPAGAASEPVAVPAGDSATHTIDWDRRHSTTDCDGAAGPAAAADTYLAEATLTGFSTVPQAPFRLDDD